MTAVCPKCGRIVSAIERTGDWRRCAGCACEFKVSVRGGADDAADAGPAARACDRCGAPLRDKAVHCHRCGARAGGGGVRWARWLTAAAAILVVGGVVTVRQAVLGPVRATAVATAAATAAGESTAPAAAEGLRARVESQEAMLASSSELIESLDAQAQGNDDLHRQLADARRRATDAEGRLRVLNRGVDDAIAAARNRGPVQFEAPPWSAATAAPIGSAEARESWAALSDALAASRAVTEEEVRRALGAPESVQAHDTFVSWTYKAKNAWGSVTFVGGRVKSVRPPW